MADLATLLGCAFAAADLLLETDGEGVIRFALGWGDRTQMVGRPWSDFVAEPDRAGLAQHLDLLSAGERAAGLPVRLRLPGGDLVEGHVSLLALPERRPSVSWAFARAEAASDPAAAAAEFVARTDRLVDRRPAPRLSVSVALIDLAHAGLDLSADRKLAASLQDGRLDGVRVEGRRYAVTRLGASASAMLAGVMDLGSPDISGSVAEFSLSRAEPLVSRHALRQVVEEFASARSFDPDRLARSFAAHQSRTQAAAEEMLQQLAAAQFRLVFQPIVDLATRRVHHYEALIRPSSDKSPGEFVAFGEALGLAVDLDRNVISSALAALAAAAPDVRLAVNVSGQSLLTEGFVTELIARYRGTRAAAGRLSIEVTESARLADLDAANSQIRRLRQAGMAVALDDFGAGAASLAYLQKLEVDMVKLDGQYVRSLTGSQRSATLIGHVVALCAAMGAETVGEMVEDAPTADSLQKLGVTYGQGWLFGAPVAALPSPERSEAPAPPLPSPPGVRARRVGAQETWG